MLTELLDAYRDAVERRERLAVIAVGMAPTLPLENQYGYTPAVEAELAARAKLQAHVAELSAELQLAGSVAVAADEEVHSLKAKVSELSAERDGLLQQAQIHAQEARTANATIAEIYQVCSDGKGEPGNWHGAEPVRKKVAELEARLAVACRYCGRMPE